MQLVVLEGIVLLSCQQVDPGRILVGQQLGQLGNRTFVWVGLG